MSITIEQSDTAIRETFYNMEEGTQYVFNDFWFAETNRVRKEYRYGLLNDKKHYTLVRKGNQLFINNNFVFDFTGKSNVIFSFSFAGISIMIALQYNGFEKMKSDTCDGKVVEIDGRKYKLTAV